jgi:glutamate dehydrogenase
VSFASAGGQGRALEIILTGRKVAAEECLRIGLCEYLVPNGAVRANEITRAERDRLLVQMTEEVAGLVLRNNYLQGQAISTSEVQAKARLSESAFVIRALERSGDLNRSLEFLPTEEEIAERRKAGEGLTRPELAVNLSYGKIWLYRALIRSDVPEDPYLSAELARYFPAPVQKRFAVRLKRHRLRRTRLSGRVHLTSAITRPAGAAIAVNGHMIRDDSGKMSAMESNKVREVSRLACLALPLPAATMRTVAITRRMALIMRGLRVLW